MTKRTVVHAELPPGTRLQLVGGKLKISMSATYARNLAHDLLAELAAIGDPDVIDLPAIEVTVIDGEHDR